MTLNRSFAIFAVAAVVAGGVLAQGRGSLDDEALFSAVEKVLHGAPALAAARISVRASDGYIVLRGFADTMEDIATAGRLAAGVRGVTGVRNEIRVADRPART